MLSTCKSYSRQAEKIMAEVKLREGVGLLKLCRKLHEEHEKELVKLNKRMAKGLTLSISRGQTGNTRGALLGMKSLNRTKIQVETIQQIQQYLEQTADEIKAILHKGKQNPAEMILPTNAEAIQAHVKKLKKEADVRASNSTLTTSSDDADSEAFLKDLLQGDGGGEAYLKACYSATN